MPSKLVLHLGLHKTATTSLQDFLASQNQRLLAAGVLYIPLSRMRSDVTPLFTSLEKGRRAKLRQLIEATKRDTILLSDENILGAPGDLAQGELYPYARNRIVSFCEEMQGTAIRIFLVLREPATFLSSMYCEYIRHNPFVDFAEYVGNHDLDDFSYRRVLGWISELPRHVRSRVIPFEAARGGGVDRIATEIVVAACGPGHGIDLSAFPSARSRASFSVEELDLAAEIARRADSKTAQMFLNMLDSRDRRFGTLRFAPLPPEAANRINAQYAADLEEFVRRGHG